MNKWTTEQVLRANELTGKSVVLFSGVEMAVRETCGSEPHEFYDDAAPCLQFLVLYLHLADGDLVRMTTYQDNDEFGICLDSLSRPPDAEGYEGIYRFRQLPELPVGQMAVSTSLSQRENLSEIYLIVGGRELMIVAGEIEEGFDGSLSFCRNDESLLVFWSRTDFAKIRWRG